MTKKAFNLLAQSVSKIRNKMLETFILVGTILSHDGFFSTVEFDLNPATNGQPGLAVLPNDAIPCGVEVGRKIYVVKLTKESIPTIQCDKSSGL